jgi:hypothetical protein
MSDATYFASMPLATSMSVAMPLTGLIWFALLAIPISQVWRFSVSVLIASFVGLLIDYYFNSEGFAAKTLDLESKCDYRKSAFRCFHSSRTG